MSGRLSEPTKIEWCRSVGEPGQGVIYDFGGDVAADDGIADILEQESND